MAPAKKFLRRNGGKANFSELGTFHGTLEGVKTKWGDDLKKATALTSRSMFNPFLESFPDDFRIEAVGQTYSALLVNSEADDTETAQPAKRRIAKKQTANAAPKLILTRTANVKAKRTTTRTRRTLKIQMAAIYGSKSIAYTHKQRKTLHLDNMMGMRACITENSVSGKGVVAQSMILKQLRGCWEKNYVMSPTCKIDHSILEPDFPIIFRMIRESI